jgi:acyl-CoA dehydrogenase
MISFELTDEQRVLRETARRFAQKEIAPIAGELDERGEFPRALYQKAFDAGLMNDLVPAEYGGGGLSALDNTLIKEEIAAGDAGVATTFGGNNLAATPIIIAGNEAQKEQYLGGQTSKLSFAGFCLTEPGSGSDAAGLATQYEKRGDKYILNGSKAFITNGGVADYFTVFATADRSQRAKAISGFIVSADTPGVVPGKEENKMGHRASNTTTISFQDAEIPAGNLLGEEGEGFKIAMKTLDRTRPGIGALAVGVAKAALAHAAAYAKERKSFGQPLAEHQGVQFMLAEMARDIEVARLATWQAAWMVDQGKHSGKESAIAKLFSTDAAMRITTDAVQIFGGYGYMKDYPVEKLMRDAKLLQIYEGTNQVQRLVIARSVLRE